MANPKKKRCRQSQEASETLLLAYAKKGILEDKKNIATHVKRK